MSIMIDPTKALIESETRFRRSWFVRLPEGATAEDVSDPFAWAKVQGSRNPLAKHDEVFAVGFSEDFAVMGVVTGVNAEAATVSLVKRITYPERTTPLFSDETYRVVWDGAGFQVMRIADGATIGQPHGSEALAIRHIRNQYPTRAPA